MGKANKHYDIFRVNKSEEPNKNAKSKWAKAWKWIKIIIVVLFIAIGLVGCVQSFTIKTNNKVGQGSEYYATAKRLSPNVQTLRYNETSNSFELKDVKTDNLQVNALLSLKSPEAVEKLTEQDKKTGGTYDAYGIRTLAIALEKPETKVVNGKKKTEYKNVVEEQDGKYYVYGQNGNFAYINLGNKNGKFATQNYTPTTKFTNIYVPYIEFEKTVDANGDEVADYTKIKEVRGKVIKDTISAGAGIEEIFLRDALQILYNESIKQYIDKNVYGFKEAIKEVTSKDITKENYETVMGDFFQQLPLKVNISSKEVGIKLRDTTSLLNSAIDSYINMSRYGPSNRDEGKFKVYTIDFVSASGNYKKSEAFQAIAADGTLVPRNQLIKLKDYWSHGPFFGLFVFPVQRFMDAIIYGTGVTGWSVILALIVTLIIVRLITFAVSFKSLFSQSKMEEFNQKKAKIEAKYAEFKNNKQMQQKKQLEIAELYKKEKISPFGQIASSFVTLPILIVVFRIISAAPEIKQATWYGISLSATSVKRLLAGEWLYLPILIFSIGIQALAQYTPKLLQRKKKQFRADAYTQAAMKKQGKKGNIVSLIIIFIGILFSAGLQIYWIIGGVFTIIQHIAVHYIQRTKWFKTKIEPKLFKN
ncbi:YidC/Oxa1 family membrane protein insertase [Metamycoplasma subdolum]|uniref:YidC/Oxa1 family membrane protein insertase n=1 Tax=Metamycoplasma subdolum TaxID=92407 RepID=A0A3M0A657_9BACT|nr:membrane protein insertase YidC [Metamycoplasma subdolum]RMA79009.1 YidC/Oxa1 family membrane protein insertase [Metamycoplasma subdolum]WPB50532.1 membrane protein insertase YidC [Metamycoplasma subdolum]